MKKDTSHTTLSRQGFLGILAAGAVIGVGGYVVYEYPPWLQYDAAARRIRRNSGTGMPISARLLELVRFATLAPNGHNAQPWKFAVGLGTIEIHPDRTRRLAVVDPEERELWISLGCALENLLIAARALGFATEVTYPETEDLIRIRLTENPVEVSALFDAIPLRQHTRSEYDGKPIGTRELDQIAAVPLEPGVALQVIHDVAGMRAIGDYLTKGNLHQYADPAFVAELVHWIRFNQKEALTSCDGLFTGCTGNLEVPRWLGKIVVTDLKPAQQAENDSRKLHSSAGAVVISSDSEEKTAWVRVGQVYERMALTLTTMNIKCAFLNQPIEVPEIREQFRSTLQLEGRPQLLVRIGYANPLPFSLRRPVEQVLLAA